jgi:hypothetical protein
MVPQGNASCISHARRNSDRLYSRSGHGYAPAAAVGVSQGNAFDISYPRRPGYVDATAVVRAQSNAARISFSVGCSSRRRESESLGAGDLCARDTATVVRAKANTAHIPGHSAFPC